jgi:hypothetical protein
MFVSLGDGFNLHTAGGTLFAYIIPFSDKKLLLAGGGRGGEWGDQYEQAVAAWLSSLPNLHSILIRTSLVFIPSLYDQLYKIINDIKHLERNSCAKWCFGLIHPIVGLMHLTTGIDGPGGWLDQRHG